MRPFKVLLVILGSLFALAGIGALIGGLVLGWVYGTQRDDDGYFTASTDQLDSETYAITSEELDVLIEPEADWVERMLGDIRLRASNATGDVFIGIGPERDVEAYLDGVAQDRIRNLRFDPFEIDYRRIDGASEPAPPGEQTFWVAQASGPGTQAIDWEIESGNWVMVLMNADASAGIDAELEAGARSDFFPVALAIVLGIGLVLLLIGAGLILAGATGLGGPREGAGGPVGAMGVSEAGDAGSVYPARLEGRLDEPLSRWLWLVKWLLAIPHWIVLFFLWIAVAILTVVAGIAILVTGRYPRGIFDFNLGVMRWTWRVAFYATNAIGTDRYPPFSFGPEPEYPATFDVAYPGELSRLLVLVKWWLLAIPHYLILAFIGSSPGFWLSWDEDNWRYGGGGSLLTLLVFIAGIVLLFRSRYPNGLFNLLMGINRWVYRVIAYAGLMTDRYPPFRLDQGGSEPQPPPTGTPAALPISAGDTD